MIERIKKLLNNDETKQLILYAVFGVLTTLVNWAVYFLLTAILKPENHIKGSFTHAAILNVSNGLGWILSVLFAFITNRKYVFSSESKNTKDKLKEFFLFVSARVLSYFLFDVLGYNLCIYALNLSHSFVKIFMNVLVVVFNYFASRFIVFSKKK